MISKTVTYVDFNGVERTETYNFHLTQAELVSMENSVEGGLASRLQEIVNAKDGAGVADILKKLILESYGVKSPDGRRFIKNDKVREEFAQTQAFSDLYMSFLADPDLANAFIKGILPNMDNLPKIPASV